MRSYHDTVAVLRAEVAATAPAAQALPAYWWKDPTTDQQVAFDAHEAAKGMLWAYTASRLSFAAEDVVRNANLSAIRGRVVAAIKADRQPVTIGAVAAALNAEGRTRVAAMTR